MKLKISKNSFLKILILTIVGITMGGNVFSQYTLEKKWGGATITPQEDCDGNKYFKITNGSQWDSYNLKLNGSNVSVNNYEHDGCYAGGGDDGWMMKLSVSGTVYLRYNATDRKVFLTQTEPSCGPSVSLSPIEDFSICPGESFALDPGEPTISGAGDPPYNISYEWYMGDDQVSTSRELNNLQIENTTVFSLFVTMSYKGKRYYDDLEVTVTVEDSDPLNINDIEGCQGSAATVTLPALGRNIYYHDGASGTYSSSTTSSSYTWGTFPSSGSETMCFAIQDDKGNTCREKCITKSPSDYLSIATQPLASQDVCQSASPTNLTVTPSVCGGNGSEVYSYQWYKNTTRSTSGATSIEGATNATYTPSTEEIGTTYYFCKVTINSYTKYTDISSVSVVGSPAPPVIEDASVGHDKNFVIPVEAEYYQSNLGLSWVKKTINSEVGKLYNSPGDYEFKARNVNAAGCQSEEVTFHVYSLDGVNVISSKTNFENQTRCIGATATQWSVQGKGEWGMNDLTYTWKKSSTNNISEAVDVRTGKTFTPSTMDAPGTYYYWCVIGSSSHSDRTYQVGPKTVTINGPSSLQIEDVAVCPNNDIVFNTDVNMSSYTVSVLRGGAAQTVTKGNNTLTIAAANVTQSENSTETYTFRTSYNGCTLEETADVTIKDGDEILLTTDISNKSITTCKGETVSTLSVAGESCASLTYQWYENSVNSTTGATVISGATSATYVPSSATAGTKYYFCEITNGVNTVVSSISKVAILDVSISFDETEYAIPASVFCSQEIPVAVKVTIDGADSTKRYGRFWWTNNGVSDGLSAVGTHTFSFNCADAASYPDPLTLQAYIVDDAFGCQLSVSKTVSVKGMSHVYYYWGPTGSSSALNDSRYWSTCSSYTDPDELDNSGNPMNFYNATKSYSIAKVASLNTYNSCVSPSNFSENGCQYIVNKDDVELLSNQIWTVSGEGSKITVGDGFWDIGAFDDPGNGWEASPNYAGYGNQYLKSDGVNTYTGANRYGALHSGYISKTEQVEVFTTIAQTDNRGVAKEFKISGKLTGTIDVEHGSSLTIATDEGDFVLGNLAVDEITNPDIRYGTDPQTGLRIPNGFNWVVVNLGSSVTYTGEGAKRIRPGLYSQLYIDDDVTEVKFEENADISIAQVFKNESNVSPDANGSTIQYMGIVNQDIMPMTYWNLQTESSTHKILAGDIEVANSLIIGAGSTLDAGKKIDENNSVSYDITISGSGEKAVQLIGNFNCWKSTVSYTSENPTTVEAMDYYNLNLGSGARTLSKDNAIRIAGTFTPGSGDKTVTGSTVEFNGNTSQSIPGFTYYNLNINNTAMRSNDTKSLNSIYFVEQTGNIEVLHNLTLTEGILYNEKAEEDKEDEDDNYWQLLVSNTASSAISAGFRDTTNRNVNVNKKVSYVYGAITRNLPSNLSNSSAVYYFPVGDEADYKPLMLSGITTSTNPQLTVSVEYAGIDGFWAGTPEEQISSGDAWVVSGTGYEEGSVGVSFATGLPTGTNAVAYGETRTGSFVDVFGSSEGESIFYTQKKSTGYYALIERITANKTYYYDCSGGKDITDIESWHEGEKGTGARATRFDETDAKWIIKCGTTINAPLTINGANSVVEISIPKGDVLYVNSDVDFIKATIKIGTVNVTTEGELTVDYGFKMEDIAPIITQNYDWNSPQPNKGNYTNRSSLINNGRVNLYLSNVILTNSYIENNGYLYTEDVDWDLSSPGLSQPPSNLVSGSKVLLDDNNIYHHTQFINNSKIEMINANIYVTDAGGGGGMVHLRNADNAVWYIDNTNKAGSSFVKFNGVEFAHATYGLNHAYVDFQCNSTFLVKHADMVMKYKGNISNSEGLNCPAWIGGNIIVEDGNMQVGRSEQGGGTFTLEQTCGNIYVTDTDNSGDGILECNGGGGYSVNVAGTLYAVGLSVSGAASGSSFNVKDHGTVYIGDIGAMVTPYSWQFSVNVQSGGTLYYCGNRTTGGDGIGANAGDLFYAQSFYQSSTPYNEHDFDGTGNYEAKFADEEQCMQYFYKGIPTTDAAQVLPVEMTVLYGICIDDNVVELRWQTASETDNSHFTILRSFDGVHFEEVDYIMGAGTTTEMNNYVYYDTDDKEGIVYYKLRQVDYDGNYTDSKVIAVQTCGKNARFSIKEDEIEVFFRNPQANYVVITSVTGQIFYSKKFTNVEEARIAVPQRKGIYIISVIDNKQITSEKFIR